MMVTEMVADVVALGMSMKLLATATKSCPGLARLRSALSVETVPCMTSYITRTVPARNNQCQLFARSS